MFLIEKQENEYRKVIWGENDSSQDYKDSVYKKHQVLVKEKVEFAKNTIRENRDDERFLKVLDIYVRNFLSLDELEAELKMFHFRYKKQKLVNVFSSLSSMQGSILPANNVLISR